MKVICVRKNGSWKGLRHEEARTRSCVMYSTGGFAIVASGASEAPDADFVIAEVEMLRLELQKPRLLVQPD